MNAQELIGSGLLEAYVLGHAAPEEVHLVERMRREHAEVARELEAIEVALEQHAMKQAVPPPDRVRARVLNAIQQLPGRVVPMNGAREHVPDRRWMWLAAACLFAFLLSAGMNFSLYRQIKDMRTELAELQAGRAVLAQELQVQRAALETSRSELAVVMDPHKQMVHLAGQVLDPKAGARVYYDQATKELYLQVMALPAAPSGKQYQFWAQVDGQMVDAGMLPSDSAGIHRMKDMAGATAFGVTLENEGGSPTPTLSALYLLGAMEGV